MRYSNVYSRRKNPPFGGFFVSQRNCKAIYACGLRRKKVVRVRIAVALMSSMRVIVAL